MKKLFLLASLAVFIAACTTTPSNQTTNSLDTSTKIKVDEPISKENAGIFKFEKEAYDFGQISEGEKVSYDFRFKNIGKNPLIISAASATCGCTIPEYPKEPVAPGKEGIIHVVFNSTGKRGMQNKVITIQANTIPQNTELHLIGNVKEIKP
ncbi:MAG: DUF1573 domain-containing protein [Daejeonella sp.]